MVDQYRDSDVVSQVRVTYIRYPHHITCTEIFSRLGTHTRFFRAFSVTGWKWILVEDTVDSSSEPAFKFSVLFAKGHIPSTLFLSASILS